MIHITLDKNIEVTKEILASFLLAEKEVSEGKVLDPPVSNSVVHDEVIDAFKRV